MKQSQATIQPLHGPVEPVDGPAQFVRFQVLRDGAEAELDALLRQYDDHPELLRVQEASRVLARALQAACLDLRRQNPASQAEVRQVLENQLDYLQACLKRSFSDY
ncbi:hypothetical protein [Pseudomonas sp. NPDC007930]|uniref:hypothetical protein n=1 Tax=Pseudomonas sp. NPDC007930 TaxID=3364417 RepID=UPI0036E2B7C1